MRQFDNLSEKERLFILATALHADLPMREVADRMRAREHIVRRTKESLIQRGVIKPIHKIDIYRLGYIDFRAYLSGITEPSKVKLAFEKRVLRFPQVYWFARMNGAFQYATTLLARETSEMIRFAEAMQPPDTGLYSQKFISIAGDWTVFPPSYLLPSVRRTSAITIKAGSRVENLDGTDHQVLSALAQNPGHNAAQLARALGMNGSSLAYRLDKLRDLEVLKGQIYLLQCDVLGVLVYRVLIGERGLSIADRERLKRYCAAHPNVVAFHNCTGGWDYEIRFETFEAQTLEDFRQTLIDDFGAFIGSITTAQQVSVLKRVSYPCS